MKYVLVKLEEIKYVEGSKVKATREYAKQY
jgi:hypothetical protein